MGVGVESCNKGRNETKKKREVEGVEVLIDEQWQVPKGSRGKYLHFLSGDASSIQWKQGMEGTCNNH